MINEPYLNKISLKLFNILIKKNLSIATAESCTGGLIAQTITNNSVYNASYIKIHARSVTSSFLGSPI